MTMVSAPERPDTAYNVEDVHLHRDVRRLERPADDAANIAWVTDRVREMEHLATGIQFVEENLGLRPARFVADEHMARLDEARAARDPDGRLHPWIGCDELG